jgi:hypothetical protein
MRMVARFCNHMRNIVDSDDAVKQSHHDEDRLAGRDRARTSASTAVVMQFSEGRTMIVWPSNIRTHEPMLPLPISSLYGMR